MAETKKNFTVTLLASISDTIWACGVNKAAIEKLNCYSLDFEHGTQKVSYAFWWTTLSSVLQPADLSKVAISGNKITDNFVVADVAFCLTDDSKLVCTGKSFLDVSFSAGSYVPFADRWIYVGSTKMAYSSVSVLDGVAGLVRSYIYTAASMRSLTLLHVQSPPVFIGSFVAGTCISTTSMNYIFAGTVRSDSGVMTAMYIAPITGVIVNRAELVNAMALEYVNPDSFIAGGLELSDGAGMQAYLVRVNSIYRRVIYGVRYLVPSAVDSRRRTLLDYRSVACSIKAMIQKEKLLYLLVNVKHAEESPIKQSLTLLKTDMATGSIAQQVHIYSYNASIECTDISASGFFLFIACTLQYPTNTTKAVVLSVNSELYFSKLPKGFTKGEEDTLFEEKVPFKGTALPLSMSVDERKTTEYTFSSADEYPTLHPSMAITVRPSARPSDVPSGQPSSSPTSAPSVSPQPTSQPSTTRPTNTYRPTVKPTLAPTARPNASPTIIPTNRPSDSRTQLPSVKPTLLPSIIRSDAPSSAGPTLAPSARPTRHPTVRYTRTPSTLPSVSPSQSATRNKERRMYRERESKMLGQVVAGLFALWCLYHLYGWWQEKTRKVILDKKRMKEMIA